MSDHLCPNRGSLNFISRLQDSSIAKRLNAFFYSPFYITLIGILALAANIFALELPVYSIYILLAVMISLFGKVLGTEIGEALNGLVIFGFFIAGCIVLWKNRTKVVAYFTENKEESRKYVYAFTTVPVLLFVIFNLLIGISMIQPLSV